MHKPGFFIIVQQNITFGNNDRDFTVDVEAVVVVDVVAVTVVDEVAVSPDFGDAKFGFCLFDVEKNDEVFTAALSSST